jgi:hypothetical protein
MGYAVALYVDAALVVLALSVIPFLQDRVEKRAAPERLAEQSVPL